MGSLSTQAVETSGTAGIRRVLFTPLGAGPHPSQVSTKAVPDIIDKVLLNAVAKARERCFTSDELKKLIKKQLSDDVIEWEEFDVGYINGKRGEKSSV